MFVVNDEISKYLRFLGFTGALNDKMFDHLTSLGYLQRSLPDKLARVGGYHSYVFNMLVPESQVASLFYANEQGTWYDPSNMSTLFQDSAGTVPVTASGQPVGLVLDKSRGLSVGPELRAGFILASAGTPPAPAEYNTSTGVGRVYRTDAANLSFIRLTGLTANRSYRITVQNTSSNNISVRQNSAASTVATIPAGATVPVLVSTATFTDVSVVPSDNGTSPTFVVLSVVELPGNHASQATAAARPTFRDVGGLRYLEFDGVDDFLVTGSINFTSTNKMSVFAGLRRSTSGAFGMLTELSTLASANNGAFYIGSPSTGMGEIAARPAAATDFIRTAASIADSRTVLSITMDLSIAAALNKIKLRRDGVADGVLATEGADTPANFGTYPLYIGRRGGASLPFPGHLYGLIVRGALTDAAGIGNAERYLATKSGVILP